MEEIFLKFLKPFSNELYLSNCNIIITREARSYNTFESSSTKSITLKPFCVKTKIEAYQVFLSKIRIKKKRNNKKKKFLQRITIQ